MYSTAITRIPVTGLGATIVGKSDPEFVRGDVTLNVVDGRLNSITVKRGTAKARNIKAHRVLDLSLFTSHRDRLVFQSYKR